MRLRITAFICALVISINCISVFQFSVCASGRLSGFENWSYSEKVMYFFTHMGGIYANTLGVIMPGDEKGLLETILKNEWDKKNVSDMTYEEWVSSRLGYDEEEKGLVIKDELADLMYEAVNIYIEEYTGWYNYQTIDYKKIPSANFPSNGLYNAVMSYCTQNLKGTDDMIVFYNSFSVQDMKDYASVTGPITDCEYYLYIKGDSYITAYITNDWKTLYKQFYKIFDSGISEYVHTTNSYVHFNSVNKGNFLPLTDGVRTVRVYKSLEDLKSYSVGQRPYFTTSKFQDYDINGDNSCIISESQLSGSSVYGDVINYIIEYPDSDGLTEDELRDILDDYFKDKEDNDGSGSGSGGSGGSGLGGFLDGIGAIGDALLGILGKLLEYVGKAIDLLSETVTKVIDIIPKNITALLGGIFPFLPEEWLTAIELSLVLAVIVGIVRIFKG